mgnify:FL=1
MTFQVLKKETPTHYNVVFENDDIQVVNRWLYDLFFNKPALKPSNYRVNDTRIVTTRVVLEDFI